jgi:sulfate adenylyltransferase subunit 2
MMQTADTPLEPLIQRYAAQGPDAPRGRRLTAHLRRLEAESIEIMREVVAEFRNPVFLYSIGKDSTVMLHLARKAFHPAKPPFSFLHIATTWDFADMIRFRDLIAAALGIEIRVHTNEEGLRRGINPIASGSNVHAQVMSTEGLKQALDKWKFDAAFGGARRDEEKSRAKERVFSFRTSQHAWEPRNQRPELWNLYNGRVAPGESIRVFPLSNWTEVDIWSYIAAEEIPVVPLYFAKRRPILSRSGALIMRDDDRMPLEPGETPELVQVRFRTLGCYPLTGAMESSAMNVEDIIAEMLASSKSERQGRLIDHDEAASMERKKREGYF